MALPKPPKEVPVCKDHLVLAPRFREAVMRVLAEMRKAGFDPVVAETLRTPERQAYLYGFGRDYDDGRGVVTNSRGGKSWHEYGLAVDVVSASRGWDAPDEFWRGLGAAAKDEGLVWGGRWMHPDRPHVQWGAPMRVSPSEHAAELKAAGGNAAVWKEVGAT